MLSMKTVVLAYSGGLDTSACTSLLKERYNYDQVITVVADIGQPVPKYVTEEESKRHKGGEKINDIGKR